MHHTRISLAEDLQLGNSIFEEAVEPLWEMGAA
jgi:hypothetical protein